MCRLLSTSQTSNMRKGQNEAASLHVYLSMLHSAAHVIQREVWEEVLTLLSGSMNGRRFFLFSDDGVERLKQRARNKAVSVFTAGFLSASEHRISSARASRFVYNHIKSKCCLYLCSVVIVRWNGSVCSLCLASDTTKPHAQRVSLRVSLQQGSVKYAWGCLSKDVFVLDNLATGRSGSVRVQTVEMEQLSYTAEKTQLR